MLVIFCKPGRHIAEGYKVSSLPGGKVHVTASCCGNAFQGTTARFLLPADVGQFRVADIIAGEVPAEFRDAIRVRGGAGKRGKR